jgi:hypothetical protein
MSSMLDNKPLCVQLMLLEFFVIDHPGLAREVGVIPQRLDVIKLRPAVVCRHLNMTIEAFTQGLTELYMKNTLEVCIDGTQWTGYTILEPMADY